MAETARKGSARVERRRAEVRSRIVEEAARRFAQRGLESVTLDQIADGADVARGTLYSHFPSKGELLTEILRPVLERGLEGLSGLHRKPAREAVDGLLDLYLTMWSDHRDSFRVGHRAQSSPLGDLATLYVSFVNGVVGVLEVAANVGILRSKNAMASARVLSKITVPLLELYSDIDPDGRLFKDSMHGLLLIPEERSGSHKARAKGR